MVMLNSKKVKIWRFFLVWKEICWRYFWLVLLIFWINLWIGVRKMESFWCSLILLVWLLYCNVRRFGFIFFRRLRKLLRFGFLLMILFSFFLIVLVWKLFSWFYNRFSFKRRLFCLMLGLLLEYRLIVFSKCLYFWLILVVIYSIVLCIFLWLGWNLCINWNMFRVVFVKKIRIMMSRI